MNMLMIGMALGAALAIGAQMAWKMPAVQAMVAKAKSMVSSAKAQAKADEIKAADAVQAKVDKADADLKK